MKQIIAKRYAEAFLGNAQESVGRQKAVEELKSLKIILYSNPDFADFLYNPDITAQEKLGVIDRVLGSYFSEALRFFLRLLIEKGRIALIADICDYIRVTYSHGETVEAVLKTSYPLDLGLIESLKLKLEFKFQKELNLFLELDASLLGGVQVRVGNKVIDGSVRRRLEELKEKLKAVQV